MKALLAVMLASACAVDSPDVGEVEQHAGSVCASGPTLYGIDVSRFQGTIDWQQVKASGVVYAYIQVSRSLTDIDMRFAYNWSHAKTAGVLRGAYQRFHPGQDVNGQADLFLQKLGTLEDTDLSPMLDVEDSDGLTGPQIAAAVKQWMDRVEPVVGRKPIIYTGFYFWRDTVGSADLSDHPLWIANYSAMCPLVPDHWSKWTFHQYSSTVMVPGITQNTTDVDRFDGTLEELQALGKPLPPPVPPSSDDIDSAATGTKPDPDGDPAMSEGPGGCSATGGGASWVAFAALALLYVACARGDGNRRQLG